MMRRLVPLVLLAALPGLLAVPTAAQAAPPPARSATPATPPSLADALQGPAKEAYSSARILMNNGDAAGALDKYNQAYNLSKDPRLLFNMAVCARGLRAYARMQGLLLRFQHEMGAGIAADDKADVEAALNAIHNFVGQIKLTVTPDDAAVTVDGERVELGLGDPLVLDLGKHTLVVARAGFQTVTKALSVEGGSETEDAVALAPESHAARLTVHAQSDASVRVDDGAATVGGFTGVVAVGTHDVFVSAPGKIDYKTQVVLRDDESRSVDVTLEPVHGRAIWPWVVGGVAVVAGGVVGGYFLFKPHDQTAPVPAGTGPFTDVGLTSWRR